MNPRIAALSLAQACYWFAVLIGISLASIIGSQLAPSVAWATLPYALISVGALATTYLLSLLMQRAGRRAGFQVGSLAGLLAALLAAWALVQHSFVLFCVASLIAGIYQASSVFYRLAALEEVPPEQQGTAVGWVLSGSLLAALGGSWLANTANTWFSSVEYLGAYVMAAVFALLAFLLLSTLPKQVAQTASTQHEPTASAKAFLRTPAYWLGTLNTAFAQFVMMLMMVVAPLAMHHHQHSVATGVSVIGAHIVGMFLPSFISGKLLDRLGARRVLWAGLAVYGLSAGVALFGHSVAHYYASLFLLGIGWNLTYIAGTWQYNHAYAATDKGSAQGTAELIVALAAVIAVVSGGVLMSYINWQVLNAVLLPLLVLVAVVNGRG